MLAVVWLLGTSGVGKSTVGYRLRAELAEYGVVAAFVDADQLRLAAGVRASETQLVAAGLRALVPGYRESGARMLIVAGLADDPAHLARLLPDVPRERVLACPLHADADAVRARIRQRAWLTEQAEQAVGYAATIDPAVADLRVDTSALTPDEVSRRLAAAALAHVERAGTAADHEPFGPAATDPAAGVVLVTGPGGVGSSTAGFQTFLRLADAGSSVAYLDAHQLGFVGADPRGRHLARLRARNARAMIGALAAHGARTVVVTADIATAREFANSVGDELDTATFVLRAAPRTLDARIRRRARGDGPPIAGDHRRGLAGRALDESIAASIDEAARIDEDLPGAHPLSTDDTDPAGVAAWIAERAGRAST
ncbi:adenylyl-sulfate kinase [Saccharopolyspora erythraea]|uniref:adenylyl-sulfate kinase n=1 Tax=Saccharopolyspora erythraea TaxID=1836 RepID=UPI001BA51047|nr:adenylyl-sulfate kinase [Saccharopolyspora erythraea]QUH00709.1 adenylyl-sulfate kinase [Saccharopolyspora erythraea]